MRKENNQNQDCAVRGARVSVGLCFLVFLLFSQLGCVRKRMTFRTNPSGAMVYVDKQPVGLTPVSTGFTYYGTRSIEVVKDGYRTEKFMRKMHAPWYQIPPLDFVSDTLWPFETRDERVIDVQLTPEFDVPSEALIASGEQLRLQAGQGIAVTPPPPVTQPNGGILTPTPSTIVPPSPALGPPIGNITGAPYPQSPAPPSFGTRLMDTLFPYGAPLSFPSTQVTPGGGFRPPAEPTGESGVSGGGGL